jgi:hypothetical protein
MQHEEVIGLFTTEETELNWPHESLNHITKQYKSDINLQHFEPSNLCTIASHAGV